jgi:hypothetical protein
LAAARFSLRARLLALKRRRDWLLARGATIEIPEKSSLSLLNARRTRLL